MLQIEKVFGRLIMNLIICFYDKKVSKMKNKLLKAILFLFLGFGIAQVQAANEDGWNFVEIDNGVPLVVKGRYEQDQREREKHEREQREQQNRQREQQRVEQQRIKQEKRESEQREQQQKNESRVRAAQAPLPVGVFDVGEWHEQGKRKTMEDESIIDNGLALYGVFDGHGQPRYGRDFATYAAQNFASFFKKKGDNLVKTFDLLESNGREKGVKGGATGIVVQVQPKAQKIVIASTGDSRAILVNGNQLKQSTNDQKIERPDEMERIKKTKTPIMRLINARTGEQVLFEDQNYAKKFPQSPARIGGVAMARTLGDFEVKDDLKDEHGVSALIHTPEFYQWNYESGDMFILACDGLWDVMQNKDVVQFVTQYPNYTASQLSEALVKQALDNGSNDNVSVLVVKLNVPVRQGAIRGRLEVNNQVFRGLLPMVPAQPKNQSAKRFIKSDQILKNICPLSSLLQQSVQDKPKGSKSGSSGISWQQLKKELQDRLFEQIKKPVQAAAE